MEKSFIAFVEKSIKENWDLDALTDYKGATLQYKDVARKIEKLHILLAESGIKPGDKVAVCGRNSSHWGVAFLATTDLRSSQRTYPSRIQGRQYTQHRQPLRRHASFLWATWYGKHLNESGNASAGRHHPDDGLYPAGIPQRTAGLCPRASE